MSKRNSIIGLSVACALVITAVAAPNAFAINGRTLFTCKTVVPAPGTAGFSREHCREADAVSTEARFEHVVVPENTTTEVTGTSIDTEGRPITSTLSSVQAGIEQEIQAELVHIVPLSEGPPPNPSWMTNAKNPNTLEHYFHGKVRLRFTKAAVTKPAAAGCIVKGETIETKEVTVTSKEQAEPEVLFSPAEGTVLAEFTLEGCSVGALNGLYKLTGSIKGSFAGATITFTQANTHAQGTLKLRGGIVGLETTITIRGTDKPAGDTSDTPLSPTPVNT